MANLPIKERFHSFITALQDDICSSLEKFEDQTKFQTDQWERPGGGGGVSRVMEEGNVFEKAGVNISTVHGELPSLIKKRFDVDEGYFWAGGLSLIVHPRSPMIPTVHANYRYFELYSDESREEVRDCWFGGGADLTPYYLWDDDAIHFHKVFKKACDIHGSELYPRFKEQCDEYFYNSHRGEARGVGGLFFDYLRPDEDRMAEDWYDFTTEAGRTFLDAFLPIVERRIDEPYGEKERYFQEVRRGRYVEFNLLHDRGTLFGLKTDGRTESVLMSLPPRVRWVHDFEPGPESREAHLLEVLKNPVNWVSMGNEK